MLVDQRNQEINGQSNHGGSKTYPHTLGLSLLGSIIGSRLSRPCLYHDANTFAERILECRTVYSMVDILQMLSKCLRGTAFTWDNSQDTSIMDLIKCIEALPSRPCKRLQNRLRKYLEYHQCVQYSAQSSSSERLSRHSQMGIYNKASCKHRDEVFDSENKLDERIRNRG